MAISNVVDVIVNSFDGTTVVVGSLFSGPIVETGIIVGSRFEGAQSAGAVALGGGSVMSMDAGFVNQGGALEIVTLSIVPDSIFGPAFDHLLEERIPGIKGKQITTVNAEAVATDNLTDDVFAANGLGRGKMAANFFNSIATVDTKINAGAITLNKLIEPVIVPGGAQPFTGDTSMGGFKITNLGVPTSPGDLATKTYADAVTVGFDIKNSCRVATAVALPSNVLSSNQLIAVANGSINSTGIDGLTNLTTNQRVLVKNEASGQKNGIYVITSLGDAGNPWVFTRSTDAGSDAEVSAGLFTYIDEGTTNADSGWVLATDEPIVLNSTSLQFVQFTGLGQISAGGGLTKTGNRLDVVAANTSLVIAAQPTTLAPAATTLVARFDATDLGSITKDGSNRVSEWRDISGQGQHVSQSVVADQPLHLANQIGGLPAVDFDGTSDYLERVVASPLNTASGEVWAVVQIDNTAVSNTIFASADVATAVRYIFFYMVAGGNIELSQLNNDTAGTVQATTTPITAARTFLIRWTSSGTVWAIEINGSAQTLSVISGTNNGDWFSDTANRDNFTLGALKRTTTGIFLNGRIGELLIYSAPLSAGNATTTRDYLSQKWFEGIQVNFGTSGSISTINGGDAADPGVSSLAARIEHEHPVSTAAPIALQAGVTALEGVATSLARSDHRHANTTSVAVNVGIANAEGASTDLSRSDHVHDYPVPTNLDKSGIPAHTSGNEAPTGLFITATPALDGYVMVVVNRLSYVVGDGVKTKDCYFSANGGVTARAIAAITAGDELIWNGTNAGFDLGGLDRVSMYYEAF